jgi:hypothetical protein
VPAFRRTLAVAGVCIEQCRSGGSLATAARPFHSGSRTGTASWVDCSLEKSQDPIIYIDIPHVQAYNLRQSQPDYQCKRVVPECIICVLRFKWGISAIELS